jgi:hypothetical protein
MPFKSQALQPKKPRAVPQEFASDAGSNGAKMPKAKRKPGVVTSLGSYATAAASRIGR